MSSKPQDELGQRTRPFIWSETRSAVLAAIDSIGRESDINVITSVMREFAEQSRVHFGAVRELLLEQLDKSHLRGRAFVAAMLLAIHDGLPVYLLPREREHVEGVLADALGVADSADKLWVAMMMWMGGVPNASVPSLVALLRDSDSMRQLIATESDDYLPFFVACALTRVNPETVERALSGALSSTAAERGLRSIVATLKHGMSHHRPEIRAQCAGALISWSPLSRDVVERVVTVLRQLPDTPRYSLIASFHRAESVPPEVAKELRAIIKDKEVSAAVRGIAAAVLGKADLSPEALEAIAQDALRSRHPQVVNGVADMLEAGDVRTPAIVRQLCVLLDVGDDAVALAALRALRNQGTLVDECLDRLVLEIGQPATSAHREALRAALARGGQRTVERLVELARLDDPIMSDFAALVLGDKKLDGARPLVSAFEVEPLNEAVSKAMLIVLNACGPLAREFTPVFTRGLEQQYSAEHTVCCLAALVIIEARDVQATEALAAMLLFIPDESYRLAERGLLNIGLDALPLLRHIQDHNSDGHRERLDRVIAALTGAHTRSDAVVAPPSGQESGFDQLLAFGNDIAVRSFVYVASNADAQGRVSVRALGLRLAKMHKDGLVTQNAVPKSGQSLWEHVHALETHLGCRLIDPGTSRASAVGEKAREVLNLATRYLAWRVMPLL